MQDPAQKYGNFKKPEFDQNKKRQQKASAKEDKKESILQEKSKNFDSVGSIVESQTSSKAPVASPALKKFNDQFIRADK